MREPAQKRSFRLEWSAWRRSHQAVAARCHATRRMRRMRRMPRMQRTAPVAVPCGQTILPPAPLGRTLSDADWERLRLLLPPHKPAIGRPRHDHHTVLRGILAVVSTTASWREMPAAYGNWQTAYKRYRLWCAEGRWSRILEAWDLPAVARPPPP